MPETFPKSKLWWIWWFFLIQFQLNILPEYEIERYVFPDVVPNSPDETLDNEVELSNSTILYRIPAGPKSPRAEGKRPSLIQHGIICDSNLCTVNKLQVAIGQDHNQSYSMVFRQQRVIITYLFPVYLLVDQGYDVWLGLSNSSMAENAISYVSYNISGITKTDFNLNIRNCIYK